MIKKEEKQNTRTHTQKKKNTRWTSFIWILSERGDLLWTLKLLFLLLMVFLKFFFSFFFFFFLDNFLKLCLSCLSYVLITAPNPRGCSDGGLKTTFLLVFFLPNWPLPHWDLQQKRPLLGPGVKELWSGPWQLSPISLFNMLVWLSLSIFTWPLGPRMGDKWQKVGLKAHIIGLTASLIWK